ncbi:hypothetical protein FRC11_007232, partial [Ceratobasidium sp. 423]
TQLQDFTSSGAAWSFLLASHWMLVIRTKERSQLEMVRSVRKREDTAGATVTKLTYGYDVRDESDEFIAKAERALGVFAYTSTPGTFLVDFFPFLKYLPWAPFKRAAAEWRAQLIDFAQEPMKFVRSQLAKGCAERSFVSSWLEEAADEDKPLIPWAAGSIYAGGADTVCPFGFDKKH